eukprot:scaffold74192_cov68-Cyclotella_meneghiniana.AAC.1
MRSTSQATSTWHQHPPGERTADLNGQRPSDHRVHSGAGFSRQGLLRFAGRIQVGGGTGHCSMEGPPYSGDVMASHGRACQSWTLTPSWNRGSGGSGRRL